MPLPSPPPTAAPTAAACAPLQQPLGVVGRALVVTFTGAVSGNVCATVANLTLDGVRAAVGDAPVDGATVVAALDPAAAVTVNAQLWPVAGAPYLIAPGGKLGELGNGVDTAPRVVLAYTGGRLLVIATSPVTLADLATELRREPDLFGATDAVERAAVVASGPGATIAISANGVTLGAVPAGRVLSFSPRYGAAPVQRRIAP